MSSSQRGLVGLLPRSLWAQTLLLLATALFGAGVIAGPAYLRAYQAQFLREAKMRGDTLAQTLTKHSDLRLAVSLGEEKEAEPVLASFAAAAGEDLSYIIALDPKRNIIAYSPAKLSRREVQQIVDAHFSAIPPAGLERFTENIQRTRDATPTTLEFGAAPERTEPELIGRIALGMSTEHVGARAWAQTFSTVGTVALGLFTLFILLYFRWVARRLERMGAFAQAIAAGNLRHVLDDPLEDDLGRLAGALRAMARDLSEVINQLVQASESLSTAAVELFDSARRQTSNVTKQAAAVTEMGSTVAELRETFNQATGKAESVIELARRSEESSTSGMSAVRESTDGMAQLKEQVGAIAKTIQGLVHRTDQIDAIIEVVSDLAEQSNVLALNASIEAARAGDQGRGFAVVAREVRSLAERSKESTSQVRSILQDIKGAGRDAVRVIEEGSRRAELGLAVAVSAGESIKRLGDAIAASSASAMQIAASTRQQSAGVEEIWHATSEIDRIATETSTGIAQIEDAAARMKSLSSTLSKVVGSYRN